jgi:hypothetical protein
MNLSEVVVGIARGEVRASGRVSALLGLSTEWGRPWASPRVARAFEAPGPEDKKTLTPRVVSGSDGCVAIGVDQVIGPGRPRDQGQEARIPWLVNSFHASGSRGGLELRRSVGRRGLGGSGRRNRSVGINVRSGRTLARAANHGDGDSQGERNEQRAKLLHRIDFPVKTW